MPATVALPAELFQPEEASELARLSARLAELRIEEAQILSCMSVLCGRKSVPVVIPSGPRVPYVHTRIDVGRRKGRPPGAIYTSVQARKLWLLMPEEPLYVNQLTELVATDPTWHYPTRKARTAAVHTLLLKLIRDGAVVKCEVEGAYTKYRRLPHPTFIPTVANRIEAVLLADTTPLTLQAISNKLGDVKVTTVRNSLNTTLKDRVTVHGTAGNITYSMTPVAQSA